MNKDVFDGFTVNVFLDEDGDYLAHFVEMPNVSAFSDTPEEALKELAVAWQGVKESYQERHQPIPKAPSRPEYDNQSNVYFDVQLYQSLINEAAKAEKSLYPFITQRLAGITEPKEVIPDPYEFMWQLSDDMVAEYDRIYKGATENSGFTGDQTEENWAQLLRKWLPRTYEVVTNGKIITQEGDTSPELDILVLKDTYSHDSQSERLYLAADVAAVFECKATLRAAHIAEAVQTCAEIKNLYPVRVGTPYKELHTPVVYGLLAHSHSWKGNNSTPEVNIARNLYKYDNQHVSHPRQTLDLLCVADLAAWTSCKSAFVSRENEPDKLVLSSYAERILSADNHLERFTPIVALVSNLSHRLAWENPTLRNLADCYRITNVAGSPMTKGQADVVWSTSTIYSEEVYSRFLASDYLTRSYSIWDEWAGIFY